MSETVPLYSSIMPVAMAGMKADSMYDNVESHPCGATAIPFGVVVGKSAGRSVAPGGTTPLGISLHDHLVASRETFTQYDAVNVLTRGRVWAVCSGTGSGVADGVAVSYNPANGQVASTGTNLPNAYFRSQSVLIPAIFPSTTVGGARIAVVELHYPMREPAGAVGDESGNDPGNDPGNEYGRGPDRSQQPSQQSPQQRPEQQRPEASQQRPEASQQRPEQQRPVSRTRE